MATHMTPAVRRAVVESVKCGVPWVSAALACGVSSSTISKWRNRGNELRAIHATAGTFPEELTTHDYDCVWLADQIESAHASAVTRLAKMVYRKAVKGNVAAAQWWLSRRAPESFGSTPTGSQDAAPAVHFYIPENGR